MSKKETVTVECPFCGQKNEFTIWHSINTVLNPEMKDAFKYGTAFQLNCSHCGKSTRVFYSCLYHQMEDKIMIYLVGEDSVEDACNLFDPKETDGDPLMSEFKKAHYTYRVVTTINDLEEKIMIFDAGKDDRAIEIYKKMVLDNLAKGKGSKDIKIDEIHFAPENGGIFLLFDHGKYVGGVKMEEKIYDDIEKIVTSHFAGQDETGFVIDSEWADAVLGDRNLM